MDRLAHREKPIMTQTQFIATFQHKGIGIGVTRSGHFVSLIDGKESAPLASLNAAETHIDREISKTKTKRVQHKVPCLVLGSHSRFGGLKYHQAIYRGINITSGEAMVTIDGTKTTVKRYHIYRLPKDWDDFEKKLEENQAAKATVQAFTNFVEGFKVSVPGIRYSDGVEEVTAKELTLAEALQG